MFLLVPAYPGCPGSKAVKRSLLLFTPCCCHWHMINVLPCLKNVFARLKRFYRFQLFFSSMISLVLLQYRNQASNFVSDFFYMCTLIFFMLYAHVKRYGDSVDNTVEENSSVFCLIRIRQQGHVGSKTLHQQNPPVLNWRCRLTQVGLHNGRCCCCMYMFYCQCPCCPAWKFSL